MNQNDLKTVKQYVMRNNEEKNIEFDIVLSPGKTIMYLQSENIEMSTSRYFVNLELNLLQKT